MHELAPRLLAGILPVLLFLAALIYLDSYKLVRPRRVLMAIALGGLAAAASYGINALLLSLTSFEFQIYSRYVAPVIEESAKGAILVYLVRSGRIGFLVDASIFGFAAGAGFALLENAYYLRSLPDSSLVVWLIRGFGTALMHGGTMTIFAITSHLLAQRTSSKGMFVFLPGGLAAIALHSAFNHMLFPPVITTLVSVLMFPPVIFLVFRKSEDALRSWLETGFDSDAELLQLINSGRFSESKVGRYLQSLTTRFDGAVVADLLCYLRIHVELSLRAKGMLLMRESGFQAEPDEETRARFVELRYLEKSIGRTARLALVSFLHLSDKELWQLNMLE